MLRNVLIVKLTKLYTVNLSISALYMLRNVPIVKLDNCTLNYMHSLSALYTLQYVPIVTYSCNLLYSKKKKKKTRTLVWVKIPKLCHNTPLSIFSLGKGRESLHPKTLHSKSALSALPQHAKTFRFGQCVDDARQNCPK